MPKIDAGMISSESHWMFACCVAVSVMRRSSASLGRIEIRFSCCDSQPTMFMKRSRLPWIPSPEFAAKSESPMTTTRVSGFGASGGSPGFGAAVELAETADPIDTGPFLSPFDSSSDTSPLASRLLMSASAQLLGLDSTNVCAV